MSHTTQPVKSKGTLLQHGTGSPLVYTTIAQRVSIGGPEMSVSVIDVTDLDSDAREKIPGLPDGGSLKLTINYDPQDATHQLLLGFWADPTVEEWNLVFPDSSTFPFQGFLTGFSPGGVEVDGKLSADVTIEVTGTITPTYPA
jgi:hypothetical protein